MCNEYLIKFSENPSAPKLENRENISMFSTCSKLTPRAPIPDGRMAQIMQPWPLVLFVSQKNGKQCDMMV